MQYRLCTDEKIIVVAGAGLRPGLFSHEAGWRPGGSHGTRVQPYLARLFSIRSNPLKIMLYIFLNKFFEGAGGGMFFLIGGVQPKTIIVDRTPGICSVCGLVQAGLKRVDRYLNLFFIPFFSTKTGSPVLICDRCGAICPPERDFRRAVNEARGDAFPRCGCPVTCDFRYCPSCGTRI